MGIFKKKERYSFAEILRGVQHAVSSAHDMLIGQQFQNITSLLKSDNGAPLSQKIKLGDREIEVPLMALVPHDHLAMEDVEISFNARVGDVVAGTLQGVKGSEISHADLQMSLEGVRAKDDDVMRISLRFKRQPPAEGLSRLTDECNKLI